MMECLNDCEKLRMGLIDRIVKVVCQKMVMIGLSCKMYTTINSRHYNIACTLY